MSDTPRTDAHKLQSHQFYHFDGSSFVTARQWCDLLDEANKLERELVEATSKLERCSVQFDEQARQLEDKTRKLEEGELVSARLRTSWQAAERDATLWQIHLMKP